MGDVHNLAKVAKKKISSKAACSDEWNQLLDTIIHPTLIKLGFEEHLNPSKFLLSLFLHPGWRNHNIRVTPLFKYLGSAQQLFGIELVFAKEASDQNILSPNDVIHSFVCDLHDVKLNLKKMVGFAMEIRRRKTLIEKVIEELFPPAASFIAQYGFKDRFSPKRGFNFALQRQYDGVLVDLKKDERDFLTYLEKNYEFFHPTDTEWTPHKSFTVSFFTGHVTSGAIQIQDVEAFENLKDLKDNFYKFLQKAELWSNEETLKSC